MLQLGQRLFQLLARHIAHGLGLMVLQALLTLLHPHCSLLDGLFGLLQTLAQLADLVVIDGQQLVQPGIVQLRMALTPLSDGVFKLLAFLRHGLPALFVGLELGRQFDGLRLRLLQLLAGRCLRTARGLDLLLQVLLPVFSTGLFADGYSGDASADFNYAGADYAVSKTLRLSYFRGELNNFYRQDFAGIAYELPLAGGVLASDVRYFKSRDDGAAQGGPIDNDMLSGQLSYAHSGHTVGAGYQVLDGVAGLPYISGATVYSFSNVGIGKFIEEDEKTWMISYAYNFAAAGVPGLTFMSRYLSGDNDKAGDAGVREWERDSELAYVVQAGTFKGLGVKLRNYVYRADYSRGRDSNRVYLTYDIAPQDGDKRPDLDRDLIRIAAERGWPIIRLFA